MDENNYISERLEDQINWYDFKSQINQKWFKSLRTIEIICAAIIPFIAGFSDTITNDQIVVGVLGIIISICAGLSVLYKYQENWLMYRTICETLRHEKYLFLTKTRPYNSNDAFNKLVEKIEGLISKENSQWSHFNRAKEEERREDIHKLGN